MRYCMNLYLRGHWNYKMSKLKLINLPNKNGLFWNFELWPVVFPVPFKVQRHTVPHLKALISGCLVPRRLRRGSTFILCHALLKKSILVHTEQIVRILYGLSVALAGSSGLNRMLSLFHFSTIDFLPKPKPKFNKNINENLKPYVQDWNFTIDSAKLNTPRYQITFRLELPHHTRI